MARKRSRTLSKTVNVDVLYIESLKRRGRIISITGLPRGGLRKGINIYK